MVHHAITMSAVSSSNALRSITVASAGMGQDEHYDTRRYGDWIVDIHAGILYREILKNNVDMIQIRLSSHIVMECL